MGLPDLVQGLIAGPALALAGPFRATIGHIALTGRGMYGPTYGTEVPREAIVEMVSETVTAEDGTEHLSAAKFTFLEREPVNEGDRIVLNGVTTTVVKVAGLLDPTNLPYLPEAWTGKP
jgi:hypothetical protein